MINFQITLATLSSIVGIVCFIPYLRDIFRHTTKPHSYTWLIWAILQSIAAAAMWSGGAGVAVASSTIGAILCGFIFVLSLTYGTKNIKLFDTFCLVGALLTLVVYLFLHDALLSIILVTLIDFIAFLPTFRKTFVEPETETASTHLMSGVSNALAIGALANFTVTTMLYLTSIMIIDFVLGFLVLIRKKKKLRI
jgi:hypothetical protein